MFNFRDRLIMIQKFLFSLLDHMIKVSNHFRGLNLNYIKYMYFVTLHKIMFSLLNLMYANITRNCMHSNNNIGKHYVLVNLIS